MTTLNSAQQQRLSLRKVKPILIGLYGLPGAGKTTLMAALRNKLDPARFSFFEGSDAISRLVSGGIEAFKKLPYEEQVKFREQAIKSVQQECAETGKCGIVTGHAIFWNDASTQEDTVCTSSDMAVFTHILFLEVSADKIAEQRRTDTDRARATLPVEHLEKWQETEVRFLQEECRKNAVVFSRIAKHSIPGIFEFCSQNAEMNLMRARETLNAGVGKTWKSILVFDADKTLAESDAGTLFWSAQNSRPNVLEDLFKSPLSRRFEGFQNATLLYETNDDDRFEDICSRVAEQITLYPDIAKLLSMVRSSNTCGAIVVTCGIRRVWEKVLATHGFTDITVIGGGRVSDGYVISPPDKRDLVAHLQARHGFSVCALGDSPLDLPMLKQADHAIVVVGRESTRSVSMEAKLAHETSGSGLLARQALWPDSVLARLDGNTLPIVELDGNFFNSLVKHESQFHLPTGKGPAQLLATPMRDAALAGPALREAHRRTGWYLATSIVSNLLGTETFHITNVQGRADIGNRLLHEDKTIVVPLMRGGEPMALGVSDAFPLAMFVHAKLPSDIKTELLEDCKTIVLVDSVINSGKSIIEFVRYIRVRLQSRSRIVIVAGVVQEHAFGSNGELARALTGYGSIDLVTLRVSGNKYKGSGGTDTGHRLFNTTHLD